MVVLGVAPHLPQTSSDGALSPRLGCKISGGSRVRSGRDPVSSSDDGPDALPNFPEVISWLRHHGARYTSSSIFGGNVSLTDSRRRGPLEAASQDPLRTSACRFPVSRPSHEITPHLGKESGDVLGRSWKQAKQRILFPVRQRFTVNSRAPTVPAGELVDDCPIAASTRRKLPAQQIREPWIVRGED